MKVECADSDGLIAGSAVEGRPNTSLRPADPVPNGELFVLSLVGSAVLVDGREFKAGNFLLPEAFGTSMESPPFFAFAAARKSNLGFPLPSEVSWVAGFESRLNIDVELVGGRTVEEVELGRPKVAVG